MNPGNNQKVTAAGLRLQQLERRLSGVYCASKLWERLSSEQQKLLGGTIFKATAKRNGVGIWMFLHKVKKQQAVIAMASSLCGLPPDERDWLLKSIGDLPKDPDDALVWAVDRGGLVVDRELQEVYWRGEGLDINWNPHGKAWRFLVIACEHALQDKPIQRDSFGANAHPKIVADSKYCLKKVPNFPSELITYFKVGKIDDTPVQWFKIPRDEVHLC